MIRFRTAKTISRARYNPAMHFVDSRLVRVASVLTLKGGNVLTNATGFFYQRDGYLFLITCRHVVIDEPTGHYPDQLKLRVHSDRDDLTLNGELFLDLYGGGNALWREHPKLGGNIDVVAVPVLDPTVIANWFVDTFSPADLMDETKTLALGQQVLVIGFPLGFNDEKHNLPMIRNATIASVYPLPFKGQRYFITDARLHRGASGSPVIARLFEPGCEAPVWKLLGVHAASLDVSNREPDKDEPLGLNVTWYASLVAEVTGE